MKLPVLWPLSIAVVAGLTVWALAGCKVPPKQTVASAQLPASCTLLAMSSTERLAHQRRLQALRQAARLDRRTASGFEFIVDLRRMSAPDLQLWMENEQKCCSFLQMTNRILASNALAGVTVACPPAMRVEVMRAFGLLTEDKAD